METSSSFKACVARLNIILNVRRKKNKRPVISAPINVVKNGLPFDGYSKEELAMRDEIAVAAASKSAIATVEEIAPPYYYSRANSCVSLDKGLIRVSVDDTTGSGTSSFRKEGGRISRRRRIVSLGGRNELMMMDKETAPRLVDLRGSHRHNHRRDHLGNDRRRPYRFGDGPMSFHPVALDSDEPFVPSGLTSPSSSSSASSIRCARD